MAFSADFIAQILHDIYQGGIARPAIDISPALFKAILEQFNKASQEGFSASSAPDPDDDFRHAIRHSNEVFSAFKVHRMQSDMVKLLTDSNGDLKPFNQWANDVLPIASHQCGAWLQTEYDTAVLRAHQAADWQQFLREADVLPNLKWMPSTSPNPGADHQIFWNTIRPINDPFWNEHRPGDRWNCKCSLTSTDETPTSAPMGDNTAQPQPGLDSNPATDEALYSLTHPYFPSSCGTCPFNKGITNKVKTFFRNEKKHCYGCSKINFALPNSQENMKKVTAEQKHQIYSMPIERQFDEVEKNVFKHVLKTTDEEDYARLLDVAKAYADKGMKVWILPEIHKSEVGIRQRIGLPSKTHTPDLWIDKKVLVDAKSPLNYKKVTHNANGASEQGGIACITNHFTKLEPAKLAALSKRILSNGRYTKDEVHFYIDGTIYKYNSQGIILG